MMVLKKQTPELLNWVLFTGGEQSQYCFPLDADDQTGPQHNEESYQDAHCQTPTACSETHRKSPSVR